MMKSDVMPSIVKMEEGLLEQLFAEADVKETIATEVNFAKKPKRTFGLVDLWNVQRNMKSAGTLFNRSSL
jgi:hypothetical protein